MPISPKNCSGVGETAYGSTGGASGSCGWKMEMTVVNSGKQEGRGLETRKGTEFWRTSDFLEVGIRGDAVLLMHLLIGLDELQLRRHTCQSHPAIKEEAQLWAPPTPPPPPTIRTLHL
ncbi:hypothetical protein ILYODFUR_020922 [Ilyodon furcidens]|uniref:Uncharacterized protein n=1 Tax=Ilyodon furcidens TaxID=33524 RepID=A0ABV0UX62_9TELE